jgi:hypothetical protein
MPDGDRWAMIKEMGVEAWKGGDLAPRSARRPTSSRDSRAAARSGRSSGGSPPRVMRHSQGEAGDAAEIPGWSCYLLFSRGSPHKF